MVFFIIVHGRTDRIRTDTEQGLNLLPLPLGYNPKFFQKNTNRLTLLIFILLQKDNQMEKLEENKLPINKL